MDYFAYLDPGTGSVIIQVVVGAILAGAVVFRNVIARVAAKFRGLFGKQRNPLDDEAE